MKCCDIAAYDDALEAFSALVDIERCARLYDRHHITHQPGEFAIPAGR